MSQSSVGGGGSGTDTTTVSVSEPSIHDHKLSVWSKQTQEHIPKKNEKHNLGFVFARWMSAFNPKAQNLLGAMIAPPVSVSPSLAKPVVGKQRKSFIVLCTHAQLAFCPVSNYICFPFAPEI